LGAARRNLKQKQNADEKARTDAQAAAEKARP
jgi:hypothetical protein